MENTEKAFKSGFVALIGRPNVGKSTLINRIINQKISVTSNRPQTTRNRIRGIYTDPRGQIIFVDTPGIIKPENMLQERMLKSSVSVFEDTDLILFITNPDTYIGPTDKSIISDLRNHKAETILVLNKTDKVPKETLDKSIEQLSKEFDFSKIIPISALTGYNCGMLLDECFSRLKEGPMYYDSDMVTDQSLKQMSSEIIREKALKYIREEVPHGIAVMIEEITEKKTVTVHAVITCEKNTHKGIIIGKNGAMLKKIGTASRLELEELFERPVNLKLFVRVRENWRNNTLQLKDLGLYNS